MLKCEESLGQKLIELNTATSSNEQTVSLQSAMPSV